MQQQQPRQSSQQPVTPQCLKHIITPSSFDKFTKITHLLFLPFFQNPTKSSNINLPNINMNISMNIKNYHRPNRSPLLFILSDNNLITILQIPQQYGVSISCVFPMRQIQGKRNIDDVKQIFSWVHIYKHQHQRNNERKDLDFDQINKQQQQIKYQQPYTEYQWLVTLVSTQKQSKQTIFQLLRISLLQNSQQKQQNNKKFIIQKIAEQSLPQNLMISTNDTSKLNQKQITILFQHKQTLQNEQKQKQMLRQQEQQQNQQKSQKQLYILSTTTTFLQQLLFPQYFQHEHISKNKIEQQKQKIDHQLKLKSQNKIWKTILNTACKINGFDLYLPSQYNAVFNNNNQNSICNKIIFVVCKNLLTTITQYRQNFSTKHKFSTFKLPIVSNKIQNEYQNKPINNNITKNNKCSLISSKFFPFNEIFSWLGNVNPTLICAKKQLRIIGRNPQTALLLLINRIKLQTVHIINTGPNFGFKMLFLDKYYTSHYIDNKYQFKIVGDCGEIKYQQKIDMLSFSYVHWQRQENWIVMGSVEDIFIVNLAGQLKKRTIMKSEEKVQEEEKEEEKQEESRIYMAM